MSLLIERQVVSRQQYDQVRTNAEALQATVRADKAARKVQRQRSVPQRLPWRMPGRRPCRPGSG